MSAPSSVNVSIPHQELHAVSERLLGSVTFQRSPRLREFLAFVVKCAVEDRAHEINEYSLGVQVFGKPADYNPNLDNIVRVTARQLRTRLAEFYAGEGASDPWRLEIPKGSYLPVIRAWPPPQPEAARLLTVWPKWALPVSAGLATAALAGWACAAWLFASRQPIQQQNAFAVAAVLNDRTRSTTVVLDDPMLPMAWNALGKQQSLDDFIAGRFLNEKLYNSAQGAIVYGLLQGNYTARVSTLLLYDQLSRIAIANGVPIQPRHCRNLEVKDLEHGNFIFIGGVGSNPWVQAIQKQLAFEHIVDPAQRKRYFAPRTPQTGEPARFESEDTRNPESAIRVSAPGVGEPERFESDDKQGPRRRLYARVASLKNPFGTGRVLLLGGTSRDATEAAGRYALSAQSVEQVTKLCGAPPEKLGSFELILETSAIGGTPVAANVVAHRCGTK